MMKKLCAALLALMTVLALTSCDLDGITAQLEELLQILEDANAKEEQPEETGPESTPSDGESPAEAEDTTESGNIQSDTNARQPEESDVPTFTELYGIWHDLVGYWNTNSEVYAVLDMQDSHTAVFRYGWWETEFDSGESNVIELTASAEEEMTASLTNGEMIAVDYSGLERDGKIRIKIGDDEWRQFTRGGNTSAEAYESYCNDRYGN